jgi:hypothetical protein
MAVCSRTPEAERRRDHHGLEPGWRVHTFTEVADFGGGCVQEINDLLGLGPVPECATPGIFETTGLPPRASLNTGPLASGTHRFQCLIHPWQRTTAEAR